MSGVISGSVFNDYDGNGIQDSSEPSAPGFKVYLDHNQNGSWTTGAQRARQVYLGEQDEHGRR